MNRIYLSVVTSLLSPKMWRLLECPRTTQSIPQSLIIAGLEDQKHSHEDKLIIFFFSLINSIMTQSLVVFDCDGWLS